MLLALGLVALALVTPACGGGSDDDRSTAPAEIDGATATAADGDTGADTAERDPASGGGEPPSASAALGEVIGSGGDPIGVDLNPSGNRVVEGAAAFDEAEPIDVALDGTPLWVVPIDGEWVVVLDDGTAHLVTVDAAGASTVTGIGSGPVDQPPLVVAGPDGPVVASVLEHPLLARFDDPLPDTRVVTADGVAAALVGPTDRYPHGVLGDRLEAEAVQIVFLDEDRSITVGPDEPSVIEGISPILADLDGDGRPEVIVTLSNGEVGAWLAAWNLDGELVGESIAIGLGNRWRNQLAAAPTAPDGSIELIDVRTPHLGGTVEYFQLTDGELVLTAGRAGFTSHRLGSRNLDEGIVVDGDGDGRLDVLVPTDDRLQLGLITRTGEDAEVVALRDLDARLTTNVAAAADETGAVTIAAGFEGVLRLWRP
ncbi:MAG: hypothetical protein AAF962_19760 [Actinomycetota bacterium]